jgi:hypothetical protein
MTFVIKTTGSLTPVPLDESDSGTFTLSTISTVPEKVLDKPLGLGTLENGEMTLSLTEIETAGLAYEVGFLEDGGQFLPTHRATLSIDTVEEGHIEVQIPRVYIVTEGV